MICLSWYILFLLLFGAALLGVIVIILVDRLGDNLTALGVSITHGLRPGDTMEIVSSRGKQRVMIVAVGKETVLVRRLSHRKYAEAVQRLWARVRGL